MGAESDHRILSLWKRFNRYPFGGRTVFNFFIGKMVPYTGTVKPKVTHIESGFVTVEMHDRRIVRNHLHSIHAIALANLGEFSSGLAMLTALPSSVKSIVTHIEIDYSKKARGKLTAEGKANPPTVDDEDVETIAYAVIRDEDNDVVAKLEVTWRLRLK